MNNLKSCLILIFCFSLFIPYASSAATEGDICQDCYLSQQASSKIVTASGEPVNTANASDGWVHVQTPKTVMATQLEAGYPNGCGITAMLYALKLGPTEYKNSYEKIPGNTDVEKIHFLVSKFKGMSSKDNPKERAFSEQYGANPNDVPWMLQSLVAGSDPLKETTFLKPVANQQIDKKMLDDFQKISTLSLLEGKTLIAQLQYANPSAAHAVVIIGIENRTSSSGSLRVQILDPLSGKKSFATISAGVGSFGGTYFSMLTFSSSKISSRSGFILSIAY